MLAQLIAAGATTDTLVGAMFTCAFSFFLQRKLFQHLLHLHCLARQLFYRGDTFFGAGGILLRHLIDLRQPLRDLTDPLGLFIRG